MCGNLNPSNEEEKFKPREIERERERKRERERERERERDISGDEELSSSLAHSRFHLEVAVTRAMYIL